MGLKLGFAPVTEPADAADVEGPPDSLLGRLRAQPERAPELIALEAGEHFGPQAERWAAAARGKDPKKLARTAYRRHVRLARLEGGALGLGGVLTAAPDLLALAWIQSRMVFFIAAAYGHDPNDPMRPAELLELQEVYPSAAEAREALDGVGKHMAIALAERGMSSERTLVQTLTRYLVRRFAKRTAGRLIPFVGAPVGAIQNAGATKELGRRALEYYGERQS